MGGSMASRNGSARVVPSPFSTVRRGNDFVRKAMLQVSLIDNVRPFFAGLGPGSVTLDKCSSARSATATLNWHARDGGCFAREDIHSTSRAVDTSIFCSRRIGDRSSRGTPKLLFGGEGDCMIWA